MATEKPALAARNTDNDEPAGPLDPAVGWGSDVAAPDIAAIARARGVEGFGPVTDLAELPDILRRAVKSVKDGRPCLVDVHIDPRAERSMAGG